MRGAGGTAFLVISCRRLIGFDERGGEQRQENFVMAGDGVASGSFGGVRIFGGRRGALDDILQRAIVLEKIEIGRRDGTKRSAQIANNSDSLEEDFRQDDSRAPIEIDAAGVHPADEGAEEAEIMMRRRAEIFAGGSAMHVRNIGADGEMDGNRNRSFKCSEQNTLISVLCAKILPRQKFSGCLPQADASATSSSCHFIDEAPGLLGHAEFALAQYRFDIF